MRRCWLRSGAPVGSTPRRLARRLGMSKVLIPPHSGVFSALGLLLAAPRTDAARTVMLSEDDVELGDSLRQVGAEAAERFRSIFGHADTGIQGGLCRRSLLTGSPTNWRSKRRATGAPSEDVSRNPTASRNGFARADEPIEVVNVRAVATGKAPFSWDMLPLAPTGAEPHGEDGVWRRETLPAGFAVAGPAAIVEANSATLLGASDRLEVLEDGTMEVTL